LHSRRKQLFLASCAVVALAGCAAAVATIDTSKSATKTDGVNLGVGDVTGLGRPGLQAFGNPTERPGILIAWRNTHKVEETEVRVRNLGTEAGKGRLSIDLVDADHQVLESKPPKDQPFVVEVPSAAQGGGNGILVQVPGSFRMNSRLDELDRANDPYCIRVRIETMSANDLNPIDNVGVKCYNYQYRMDAHGVVLHQYTFWNNSKSPMKGTVKFEERPLPAGWTVEANPKPGTSVRLAPGEFLRGSVTLRGPDKVKEGSYADIRPMLLSAAGDVVDKTEFFVAADRTAPKLTSAFVAPGSHPGTIYLNVRSIDSSSGVAEASGAQVIFSTDNDPTHTVRTLTYTDGNFTAPTGFDTDIGPFPAGTTVEIVLAVHDVAGNEARTKPVRVTVPVTEKRNLL